jgi:hypothetical protein
LGVRGFELFLKSFQARYLLGSSRGPIQRIEHQHDIFLPLELAQGKLGSAQVTGQFEIRSLFADFDHDDSSFLDYR